MVRHIFVQPRKTRAFYAAELCVVSPEAYFGLDLDDKNDTTAGMNCAKAEIGRFMGR
jgi:hypothetical protein